MRYPVISIMLFILGLFGCARKQRPNSKPNILIIEADDMGFSDIGAYGGNLSTPNIDRLAKKGIRFTQFHNVPICSPSRASLLTGLYPQQTGVGFLTTEWAKHIRDSLGYMDHLNKHCITLAEGLKPAGYKTYMVGKWHVGQTRPYWPVKRGFDQSVVRVAGYDYFNPDKVTFVSDGKIIKPRKKGFYMTNYFTKAALNYLKIQNKDTPFLMYLAYTAPHFPLQAPEEEIAKYQGTFMAGWDTLRRLRYKRMKQIGIIKGTWPLSQRFSHAPLWESLSTKQKKAWDRKMAVYEAQINIMDQGIGKIMQLLKKKSMANNTLVLFLSDNGASPSPINRSKPGAKPGTPASYTAYGTPWANLSDTPFRLFKRFVHEGGTSTPLIAYWPDGITRKSNNFVREQGHVMDIMATVLDVAGVSYPQKYHGQTIIPLKGKSLVPYFRGKDGENHKTLAWDLQGNRAIIDGKWKLVSTYRHRWELYNITIDRTETHNLASKYPKIVKRLTQKWQQWADKVGVEPWEKTGYRHSLLYKLPYYGKREKETSDN